MSEADGTTPTGAAAEPMAWADPETASRWKRAAATTAVTLVIGTVLFVGFVVYVDGLTGHETDLLARGIPSTGKVLADPKETLRCGQVPVPIRFPVGGGIEVHPYYVDSCGSGLHAGDVVDVRYDPDDPGDFLVDGEASEEPGPTLLAVVALVGSGFLLVGGTARAVGLVRRRWILRRNPWTLRPALVAPFSSPWVKGFAAIELHDADSRRTLVSGSLPVPRAHAGAVTELRVAGGAHGSVVVDGTRSLGLAHPPRWFGSRRRAARSIERWTAQRTYDAARASGSGGQPSART